MNEGLNYLQTFNPAETKPELLEQTLIGRKDLVDLLEKLVIEGLKGGNRFQQLIIGPRGSGKTHLLKVLHNRIFNSPQLKAQIEIAYLIEDEYGVATFLDWIIRILRSFIRWYPEKADHLKKEIEKLKKVYDDDKERLALKILLDYIKERTLLIIVENIGDIFHKKKGFGKKGQQKFRDLIQQYPSFTIIASNQALFEDIQKEDMPFHNFFKIIHLNKLNLQETILFLRTIAEWEKNIALLKFLDTAEGRGRITAIYDLVGGNHRLLVTFYNFLKSDFINKLSASFTKTINDLIPYYQSLMGQLSSQQQKIVQYLCQIRIPSNVKNIAENCFSAPNTISKQLINLVRLKYINSVESTGRETFYELAEPLLRICHEVKENRGGPIKLFIDFLGNLYTAEEIKHKFMHYHILATTKDDHTIQDCLQEQIYYKETLKFYFPKVLESDKFIKFETSKNESKIHTYIEELEEAHSYPEIIEFSTKFKDKDPYILLKEATAFEKTGAIEEAKQSYLKTIELDKNNTNALFNLGILIGNQGDHQKAFDYFQKVTKLQPELSTAWRLLGMANEKLGKLEDAQKSYLKTIELDKNNTNALFNLGILIDNQGDHQKAFDYFQKVTKLQPEWSEAWRLLGMANEKLGKLEEAKQSFLKAIELDKNNTNALINLGILFASQDDYQKTIKYIQKVTKLQPEWSEAWRLLGMANEKLGKLEEAKQNFLKAVELDEKNYDAHLALAEIFSKENKFYNAKIYIDNILKEDPKDSSIFISIGEIYRKTNHFKKAITFYEQAIKLNPDNYWSYMNIVTCQIGLNNIGEALIWLKQALEKAAKNKLINELIEGFGENLTMLFIFASEKNIVKYLQDALILIKKYNYLDQFYKSNPSTIFAILREYNSIETEKFDFIFEYLNKQFKDVESMIVPLKFLDIGIRYLKRKEKIVLMQFTKEERATFKKFVLDNEYCSC